MNESIKPCRLCGSHGRIVIKRNNICSPQFTTYSVVCSFCETESGIYFSVREAINNWNEMNGQVKCCA